MTDNKLEQIARQALEALEQYHYTLISAGVLDKQHVLNQGFTAHAALREALDQHKPHEECECSNCLNYFTDKAHEEALAEQAEQEPNYFGLTHDHTWLSIDKKQYDKLKPEGRMACYAAPARTKDLTDDELREIMKQPFNQREYLEQFAHAVIAADREKNKC